MKVKVAISNRHIHLTKETYEKLFGKKDIEVKRYLNQLGEFASNDKVTIENNGKIIENVRIVGPFRDYDQVELLQSDLDYLGIKALVKKSGNLDNTPGINIIFNNKKIFLEKGVIKAERHIHINTKENKYNFIDDEIVIVHGPKCDFTARIKISDNGFYELHIDKDESTLFNLNNGDEVSYDIIK